MGLFTEAILKSRQPDDGDTGDSPDIPLDHPATCELAIATELESALDLLWARLRNRDPRTALGRAFSVTHWEPREGATTLAAALAHRAAQVDPTCTFCLADFDLFSAGLSFLAGLEAEPGISNILLEQTVLEESLCGTAMPNLMILPAGYPTVGRHAAQMYDRCQAICGQLSDRFSYVFLDLPCLRVHPNFAFWAGGLTEALLVVRAGQARRPAIAKAIGTLQLMRLDIAGLVLNSREYHVPKWLYNRT